MKALFTLFLSVFSIVISVSAQSGGSISGLVLIDDHEPLANAKITLSDSKGKVWTTLSDEKGRYIFSNLEAGNYKIMPGLPQNHVSEKPLTGKAENIEIGKDQEVTLDLLFVTPQFALSNLTRSAKIRETVNISTDSAQPVEEISKTVNVISAQEMRDRADFSLIESLRTIPGFRVQQLGGFGRTASIKTRGLRNQDTAILIDGIRFRDASAITGDASSFLSDFTLTSVSRIEVLRGSGSSLYGTNAIGGVVNFQTPGPQRDFHGQISTAFGGYGLQRYRANLSDLTDTEKFGYTLAVSRTLFTKGIDGDDDAHNTNFQSRLEFRPTGNTNISGRFFVSDAFVKLNSNPDTSGTLPSSNATIIDARQDANFVFDVNDPDNSQKSHFFSGQVSAFHAFKPSVYFQGSYQGLKTSRRNQNGLLGVGFQSASTSIFGGEIHTANARLNWTPNQFNEITLGYEFEAEKFANDGFTPTGTGNFSTDAKQSSQTFFAQDLLSFFNQKLQLAGGFRAQFFSLDTPTFSKNNPPYANLKLSNPPTAYTFDGAASYFFEKSKTKLRAHIGNGYRVPSLYERFGTFYSSFSAAFIALGDPNLKPEKTIAFDGGIEQYFIEDKGKFSATYFYTKLIDTIGFGNVVPNIGTTSRPFGGYLNQKGGISRGAEFSVEVKPNWIKILRATTLLTSYTYTNSDQLTPQVSGSRIYETLGVPKHQFTLVATRRFKDFWVNADFVGTSDYLAPLFSNSTFSTYVYRFKGNRKMDLTAGYNFRLNGDKLNLRLFGTVENLFDYEYFESGFRTFGRTGRIGLSFGF